MAKVTVYTNGQTVLNAATTLLSSSLQVSWMLLLLLSVPSC